MSKGGGQLGCNQHVEVTLLVPVTFRMKPGGFKGSSLEWRNVAPARYRNRGIRLRPTQLEAAFYASQSLAPRVGCPCGWSWTRMRNALKLRPRG